MISDKKKAVLAAVYLLAAAFFVCIGDAYNLNWYVFFYENELFLDLSLIAVVYSTIKNKTYKRVFEVLFIWKLFYVIFNIAVLFEPFNSYRDFTSNPVVRVQLLWCLVGFSIIQVFRK